VKPFRREILFDSMLQTKVETAWISDIEFDRAMSDILRASAALSFLLLLTLTASQIPRSVHADTVTVAPFSPGSGVTVTSGSVVLAVTYTNSTGMVPMILTDFYVQAPGSPTPIKVGNSYSDFNGYAYLPYGPLSPGLYQWKVNYYPWDNSTSVSSPLWTFNCGIPPATTTTIAETTTITSTTTSFTTIPAGTTTQWNTITSYATVPIGTTTQWATTAYTRTVGILTQFSYLYETATSTRTAYTTQTISRTTTTSLPTTLTKTSTAFATTQTTPVTYYETESTTLTEMSYATMSLTQYVYLGSYAEGQVLEKATIQQIPNGSNASAHFHNHEHNVETITIGIIDNATNVEITVAKAPEHTNVGMNTNEYGSFEIFATNLSEDNVKSVVIEFKVEKNWLSTNQIPQDRVNLYRYENGKWTKLETSLLRTDETYAYYKATSPGLSVFAIAGESSSFFQIPGVGSIADSYVVILPIMIATILGAYGAIRIKKTRSRKGKEENVSEPAPTDKSSEDQIEGKLLDYITNHGGSISLSKAAEDLGVLPTTVKEAIGKLKSEGKLAPV
jgi:PGF-pre-PGF domain-containing protein